MTPDILRNRDTHLGTSETLVPVGQGRFAAVDVDQELTGFGVTLSMVDAKGRVTARDVSVVETEFVINGVSAVPLAKGRFLVTWDERSDSQGFRIYDRAGVAQGPAQYIEGLAGGDHAATTLPGGRALVAVRSVAVDDALEPLAAYIVKRNGEIGGRPVTLLETAEMEALGVDAMSDLRLVDLPGKRTALFIANEGEGTLAVKLFDAKMRPLGPLQAIEGLEVAPLTGFDVAVTKGGDLAVALFSHDGLIADPTVTRALLDDDGALLEIQGDLDPGPAHELVNFGDAGQEFGGDIEALRAGGTVMGYERESTEDFTEAVSLSFFGPSGAQIGAAMDVAFGDVFGRSAEAPGLIFTDLAVEGRGQIVVSYEVDYRGEGLERVHLAQSLAVWTPAKVREGEAGRDTLKGTGKADAMAGRGGDDKLLARGGADLLDGGDGADLIVAGKGDDTVFGGAGDDVVRGDAGDDILRGGEGDDSLAGGPDADLFIFEGESPGRDRIADFEPGVDVIDVAGLDFRLLSFDSLRFELVQVGADVEVRMGDPDSDLIGYEEIVLEGVAVSALSEDDFIFGL